MSVTMNYFYISCYALQFFLQVTALPIFPQPISLKKYDQGDILLDEEDKRDIFRDIKTIYAPEFRIYSNASISNFNEKEKRHIQPRENIRIDNCITNNHVETFPSFENQENHFDEDELEEAITNNVMEQFDISDRLVDKMIFRNKSMNTIFLRNATDTQNTTKLDAENASQGDNLNISSFWHSTLGTYEIRNMQSAVMKKFMNPNVEPCNDFYEYACGHWKNYYSVPPDRATYDTFEIVRENLDKALKELLEKFEEIVPSKELYFTKKGFLDDDFFPNDTTDATIKAKILYSSCIREDLILKRGDKPLTDILEKLGGWPIISKQWNASSFDIISLLARLRLLNNDVLISQWVGPDMKNSNEYIIHIDQTTLGLPSREYYLEETNLKYVRAYTVFILTVAELLKANPKEAEKDVDEMVKFETQLAEIMASTEERRNISEMYLRTDLASLSLYFPQFDWKEYFGVVLGKNVDLKTPVACYCARFLHELIFLISNTSPRTLQNYLIWRFVRHRTNNMDRRFLEAKQRFYHILFGREKQPPRWQFCVSQVNSNMGMALGSLFVKKYFDQKSKTDTIEMTKELEEAFKSTLLENTWLDNNTKEYAKMKLDYMDLKIGFPNFILNETDLAMRYYDIQLHPDYFFENIMTILRHITRAEQKRLGTSVNRTLWSTPPAIVNAYYSRNKNQIMFPAGMLQPPFYNRHFPKALNFGGIGVVIGHEITHGFDDKGRLFDHEGNLHLWWRESSIEKFYEKSQCMIDQYGQYVLPEIRLALDGYLTQGENIADNGGLKQAFRAYDTWLKAHPSADETLPNMKLNGRQLFFLNFAQVWCGQQRIEAAKSRLKTSVHSPGIFRVIGALSNSEDFSRVYNCPKNSPMNPEFKCIIW